MAAETMDTSIDQHNQLESVINISRNFITQPEEAFPDDSLLYAVVIGLLYAFIMAFLIMANLHPSQSLLSELQMENSTLQDFLQSKDTCNYEEADVNLNTRMPFEYQSYFRHNGHYPLDQLDLLLWLQGTRDTFSSNVNA